MNPLTWLYHEGIFRPLFNLLVGTTNLLPTHNVGLAIIFVTIITRVILLPFSLHQARQLSHNQRKMEGLQSELKRIQEQHKNDQARRAEATMALYRKAGVNPAGGCLPLLVQLPILLGLYRVFLGGLRPDTWHWLYSFVPAPQALSSVLLGVDLTVPSLVLAVLVGVAQLAQMRWFNPTPSPATAADDTQRVMQSMQQNMLYIFPVMTVLIALRLPSALSLYWLTSTALAIFQQVMIKRTLHLSIMPPTT